MKKLVILIILLSNFLISCSDEINKKTSNIIEHSDVIVEESVGIIKESGEIISNYVDTLEGTIMDAKKIKKTVDTAQEKLKEELNNLR